MAAIAPRQARRGIGTTLASVATLGTSDLLRWGTGWLGRNGLGRYVIPVLLANECFGAWRVYAAGSAAGWW